jgi:hypothetical protein
MTELKARKDKAMTLEQAMEKSEANSALNFSHTGWIVVDGRKVEQGFSITTELNPKPRQYTSLEAVKEAVRLYKSDQWEPYNRFEAWD